MPYTLWSRDRLLGESALDYISNTDTHLMGDFFPTEFGESQMTVITGISRAFLALRKARLERERDDRVGRSAPARVDVATEYADVAEATNRFEELELQLRGPDGGVLDTEYIGINDYELALEWCDVPLDGVDEYDELMFDLDDDEELMAAIDHDAALIEEMLEKNAVDARESGEWVPGVDDEKPLPRFQIQVRLAGAGDED